MDNNKLNTTHADLALKIAKILQRLITCLSQESLALKSHNRSIAASMMQQKTLLMHDYKTLHEKINNTPDFFQTLDQDIKDHLHDLIAEFETVLRDNALTVYSGKNAVSRVISRILKKARDMSDTAPATYNNQGKLTDSDVRAGLIPTKLNETF